MTKHKILVTPEHLKRAIEKRTELIKEGSYKVRLNCHCVFSIALIEKFGSPVNSTGYSAARLENGMILSWDEGDTYFFMRAFDAGHFYNVEKRLPCEVEVEAYNTLHEYLQSGATFWEPTT